MKNETELPAKTLADEADVGAKKRTAGLETTIRLIRLMEAEDAETIRILKGGQPDARPPPPIDRASNEDDA